jgi:hypothetical protein
MKGGPNARTNGATAAHARRPTSGAAITVNRLGFAAMRITGRGIWGEPPDRNQAQAVLRRAVELGPGGTASSTSPTSLETDFGVVPLREFGINDASRSPRS